ncbi:MAG: toast rack family protein [Coriobacteriia bacterium]|nr:toast rack family protein [Coriobacteriia bacterium]
MMKRTITLIALALLALAALTATTGCTRVKLQDSTRVGTSTETTAIPVGSASAIDTELRMGVGELTLSADSSSTSAFAAECTYAPKQWKPEFASTVESGTLAITVNQLERIGVPPLRDTRNAWKVVLGGGRPTRLKLRLGVGAATLDLRGLDLTELDALTGVGETTVDLSGPRNGDLAARIEAGVGSLKVRLPKDVGVRVNGRQDGLGDYTADGFRADGNSWVNDAWGGPGPKIEIDLIRGVGDVTLVMVP